MTETPRPAVETRWGVLGAAFLFNVGQGVLRPSLPLYLQATFHANYRLVTSIPTVFGFGRWLASVPTGLAIERVGHRTLMVLGLLVVALSDIGSVFTTDSALFLGVRGLAGVGWAMFATAATTTMIQPRAASQRARGVSLLLMSETAGLFLGSLAGGWLYIGVSPASPFFFEAGCMLLGSLAVARGPGAGTGPPPPSERRPQGDRMRAVLRLPGVPMLSLTSAALTAVQVGLVVFLFPLYATVRAGVDATTVGLLVAVGVLGRLGALWIGGSAPDRERRFRLLVPGLVGYATLLAVLGGLTHPLALLAWNVAAGAAAGLVMALPAALVGDLTPPPLQGVAIGWFRTVTDTGQIVGPLVLGGVADLVGLPQAFGSGALLLVLAAVGCWRLKRIVTSSTEPCPTR